MTNPAPVKQILAVIPPKAGGRTVGAHAASSFGPTAQVTVVETTGEDKAALRLM